MGGAVIKDALQHKKDLVVAKRYAKQCIGQNLKDYHKANAPATGYSFCNSCSSIHKCQLWQPPGVIDLESDGQNDVVYTASLTFHAA